MGQTSAQEPQSTHLEASISYWLAPWLIASTGQLGAQAPQETQSLLILYAMNFTSIIYIGTLGEIVRNHEYFTMPAAKNQEQNCTGRRFSWAYPAVHTMDMTVLKETPYWKKQAVSCPGVDCPGPEQRSRGAKSTRHRFLNASSDRMGRDSKNSAPRRLRRATSVRAILRNSELLSNRIRNNREIRAYCRIC